MITFLAIYFNCVYYTDVYAFNGIYTTKAAENSSGGYGVIYEGEQCTLVSLGRVSGPILIGKDGWL